MSTMNTLVYITQEYISVLFRSPLDTSNSKWAKLNLDKKWVYWKDIWYGHIVKGEANTPI